MTKTSRKATIFAVDDEPDILKLVQLVLTAAGHAVEVFYSGKELLDRLKNKPGPDLILLDVMMPVLDGFEVCRQIRQNGEFVSLPVVFLTAKAQDPDYMQGLASGGTSYIEKPFDVERLPAKIAPFLWNKPGKGKRV